ncbi:MAG: 1-deoxy-D-xylulose-5-phosphate reductoisomerase [Trueperaceae bacterium]|nr:1-deoxy-D-xylulose-5-phosphate reductoisomerase [Trueperaceae bacterium]
MRTITVLGSTGSIGTQTLEVARWREWRVTALVAGRDVDRLAAQADAFRPEVVACDPSVADVLAPRLPGGTRLDGAPGAAERAARLPADTVIAAIPGMAGLAPVRAALGEGRHVALATKEAMVVAGPLMRAEAARHGGRITPVDSEHAGVDQALRGQNREAVAAIVLTASGGPFREGPADLRQVTPAQALKHPTWRMGPKVTIDSATLFNKGLEVLEAHHLFEVPLDRIEVVVHPQSWVHALVRFRDGNLLAQVGPHDMRLPIQWAVEGDARPAVPLDPFPLRGRWEFEPPDVDRFPALGLAYEAGRRGGTAPAILNAADEVAVPAFLDGRLPFDAIPQVLAATLDGVAPEALGWEALREADADARRVAGDVVGRRATGA